MGQLFRLSLLPGLVLFFFDGAHARQKDLMAQGEIVEEISNKEVLYSLGYRNASCAHALWVRHGRQCLIEVVLHCRHGKDVAKCKFCVLW